MSIDARTDQPATLQFTLRPARLDDLPEAVAMFNLGSRELHGHDEFTLEDYQNEWKDPTINLATDTRIAQASDGRIVGCIEVWNSAPHLRSWVWGRVHPAFRGQGVGTALMEWAERRARDSIAKAPQEARVTMLAAAVSTDQPTIDLLSDRGMRAVRHSLTMERDLGGDLPAPIWADGLSVRTMQPGDERAVYRALAESFKDHWGNVEQPEEQGFPLWRHRAIDDPAHDPSLWFLAIDGNEIAGISLCRAEQPGEPDLGWVNTLGVRRPWRRRGVGLALLYHSFAELRRRGRRRVGLGVDASSLTGATRLYERAGMRAVRQYTDFMKELRPGTELMTQSVE
ncbi:MAG: GNAT family N-acetyltransferase [Kouleothrix sp.]|nr:GNAT family N-acetyltransferase [Kouleothrix sp.]